MAEVTSSFKPYVVSISGLANSDETSWKGVPILRWWHEGSVTLKGWVKVAVQYTTKTGEQISWNEYVIESGQTRTFSNTEGQDMTIYLLETAPAPPPPPVYTCPYCPATFNTQEELDEHITSEHPDQPPPGPGVSGIHLMFGVGMGEDHNRARNCECNLIYEYGPLGRAWLDKAAAAGLWGLYNLKYLIHDELDNTTDDAEKWNIWNSKKAEVAAAINEVKDHPALYGYYTLDEPNGGGARAVPLDLQQEIYDFIKSVDPDHIVAVNIVASGAAGYEPVNFDALDVLIPDQYCFGANGLPDLVFGTNNLRTHLDSIGFNKPIIFLIQACDNGGSSWEGHVRDQIDIVLNENLATGGIGIWNWNLPGGPGRSDRSFNEVRDAWGKSDWPGPGPVTYTCPYCGATFSSQAELDTHIENEHPGETFTTKEVTCTPCSSILRVTISSIAENNRTLTCPLCQTTLSQAGTKVEIVSTPVIDQLRADIRALDEQIGQAETKVAEAKAKIAEAKAKVDAIKKLLGM